MKSHARGTHDLWRCGTAQDRPPVPGVMLVRWTKPATDGLRHICDYTEERFGSAQARRTALGTRKFSLTCADTWGIACGGVDAAMAGQDLHGETMAQGVGSDVFAEAGAFCGIAACARCALCALTTARPGQPEVVQF